MTDSSTQQRKLYEELRIALKKTSAQRLKTWGRDSAARLPGLAARRVKNLGRLLAAMAKFTGKELWNAVRAISEGRFGRHLEKRSADAIDGTIDVAKRITKTTVVIGKALFDDPKKNAPGVLALALGFLAGSGGIDGNGGVPDTDITYLGIGAHRSILTFGLDSRHAAATSLRACSRTQGICAAFACTIRIARKARRAQVLVRDVRGELGGTSFSDMAVLSKLSSQDGYTKQGLSATAALLPSAIP